MSNKYIRKLVTINGKRVERYEHRLVWEEHYGEIPKGMVVDHIDGNKSNNDIKNLQVITRGDNIKRSVTASRSVKGYRIDSRSKYFPYVAQARIHGKKINVGAFGTPAGATIASKMAKLQESL